MSLNSMDKFGRLKLQLKRFIFFFFHQYGISLNIEVGLLFGRQTSVCCTGTNTFIIESTETVDIQLFSTWDYVHFLLSQCKETIS